MSPSKNLRTTLRLTLAAAAIAVTGLAGCSNNDMSDMPGMDQGSGSPAVTTPSTSAGPSTASTPTSGTPTSGNPAAGPHNDADVMFATMMIPHHQQAIEMSGMILAKQDITAEVTELAQQIKAAQGPEISQMSGWLAGWGENPSPMTMDHDMGGGGMGDGMMTQAEMDALEQADGDGAARLFLKGMIKHHQGAITMAQKELVEGQNSEAKQLAQQIIDDQKAEITTMNQLYERI